MDEDDVREQGQPEPRRKTDQEVFDEQIARASGKFISSSAAWASWQRW
jgi:hypothetical protein